MSQVQLRIKKPNYFGEQQHKDTPLSLPSALMWTASPLRAGPHAHTPCSLMRNIPGPRRGGGQVARNSPYRCLPLACLWGVACGLWKSVIFCTRKLYGRFHYFAPVPFKDARWEGQLCIAPVRHARQERGKAGEFSSTNSFTITAIRQVATCPNVFLNYPNPVSQQPNYVPEGKSYLRDRKGLHVRRY